ncbi:MAG: uroporphyrinogen-III synthase [Proteobacteria bacterium]|nr:uroporphyrinogen-III synthase [Pseudomonadota bacterium]
MSGQLPVSGQVPVLITRPLRKGQELAALLQSEGVTSLVAPAFEIRLMEGDYLLEHKVQLLRAGTRLIFPSVNAVAGFFQGLENASLQLPVEAECIAVGPATAQALQNNGVEQLSCSTGTNSEALLELPGLQAASAPVANIFIISAPGGRSLIEETLRHRGYSVHSIHVYQRHALALPAKTAEHIRRQAAVNSVFTSAMALDVVFSEWPDFVAEKISKGQAVVISERLKRRAIACGIQSVRVSTATDNRAICNQLVQQTDASEA